MSLPVIPVPFTDRSCLTVAEMVEQFAARFRNAGAPDLAARLEHTGRSSLPSIPVFTRARYGVTDVWPADAAQARSLYQLTGCRTLTPSHLTALQDLGFSFRQVADPKGPRCIVPLTTPSQLECDTA